MTDDCWLKCYDDSSWLDSISAIATQLPGAYYQLDLGPAFLEALIDFSTRWTKVNDCILSNYWWWCFGKYKLNIWHFTYWKRIPTWHISWRKYDASCFLLVTNQQAGIGPAPEHWNTPFFWCIPPAASFYVLIFGLSKLPYLMHRVRQHPTQKEWSHIKVDGF